MIERWNMDWINRISNNDSKIKTITIEEKDVVLHIELWNGIIKNLRFINCMALKEKQCLGDCIGDIYVDNNSCLLKDIQDDILNGGGSLEETKEINTLVFMDEWNERILLEILSESVTYD